MAGWKDVEGIMLSLGSRVQGLGFMLEFEVYRTTCRGKAVAARKTGQEQIVNTSKPEKPADSPKP